MHWLLEDRPSDIFAFGSLSFYGEQNAIARGQADQTRYDRYTGEAAAHNDPFALSLDTSEHSKSDQLKGLYLDAEAEDGYIRDRNVFGHESAYPITAEDTMVVSARYPSGVLLNYSLIAYCPWGGERLTITGTEGQIEYFGRGAGHVIAGQDNASLASEQTQGEQSIRVQRMFEPARDVEIPEAEGAHGGGDIKLLERIFLPDHHAGAMSVLTGVTANRSIETGQRVELETLLPAFIAELPA
ncbi:MAG: Gfo/Idh/MocA family oxidoreductase [Planctomycetota bacterium]